VFAGCLDNAELTVLDRSPERAEAYVEWARKQPGIAAASVATDLAAGLADADVVLTAGTICPAGGSTYENAGFIMSSDLCPLSSPGVLGQGMKLAARQHQPALRETAPQSGSGRVAADVRGRITGDQPIQGYPTAGKA